MDEAVFEQQPVGQIGQRIGKGALAQLGIGQLQLGIGFLQRLIELEGCALQARIEQGAEHRRNQQHDRGDDDDGGELGAAQGFRTQADRAAGKAGSRHPGVVHAADGKAHDQCRQCLEQPQPLAGERKKCTKQSQRRGRGQYSDQSGGRHQRPVPGNRDGHLDG